MSRKTAIVAVVAALVATSCGSDEISVEEAQAQFGHLLEAFEYGAPPHGGIALGLDRITMILADEKSIREVIAFPKTATGTDLLFHAPSPVADKQLRELQLRIVENPRA